MAKYTPSEPVRTELAKVWQGHMFEYCCKKLSNEMYLDNGGYLTVDKPDIETRFCFGYSVSRYDTEDFDRANNMARHASESEEYFLNENLKELRSIIEGLDKNRVLFFKQYTGGAELYHWCYDTFRNRENYSNLELIECSDRELESLRQLYKEELTKFEKRLHTYLKRYGMSKIRTWSYWRDE
jgi:hypothetical protein